MLERALSYLAAALEAERDRWFLWVPVCFGVGIALYFGLASEPTIAVSVAPLIGAVGFLLMARGRSVALLLSFAVFWAALGFLNAKLRTYWVKSPVLVQETRAVWIEGWLETLSPQLPKGYRLILRPYAMDGVDAEAIPYHVRVTARFDGLDYGAGTALRLRAVLRPVPEPVAPGGFDFARRAWFERLGAVGYALGAPTIVSAPREAPLGLRIWAQIDRLRAGVEARLRRALPGSAGAIANALITGERSAIPEQTLEALRHSGLAHVLAISGLHMALIAGTLFWCVRAGFAALPALALRYPIKKWSAVIALAGAAFYLLLSGAGIATQRAFLMMAVMFVAILLDRPALTLRNVALAGLVILVMLPESLFNVSFQMSFAATVALVAFYEGMSGRIPSESPAGLGSRLLHRGWRYVAGIALTTLVASIAVAPFAAYHFHKVAQYSLFANLAAMPIVGLMIMPWL